jgi:hypothetical protein
MVQGQVFELTRRSPVGQQLWAYRYRTGGRDSKRMQRGGFASEEDARDALEREPERLRREQRISSRSPSPNSSKRTSPSTTCSR